MSQRASHDQITPATSRQRTYQVISGRPVLNLDGYDARALLARKGEVEKRLAATKNRSGVADERRTLIAENEMIGRRLGEIREAAKVENARRNFAGLTSPLHDAIVARLDAAIVLELEREALRLLSEREKKNAERRAAKVAP